MFNHLGEAIQWIETQVKFKPKTDLIRLNQAYALLNLDLSHTKKIHVAGTNGKGSVCAYLSRILIEAGYKVGTYTSPYLLKFNERIRYQFEDMSDDDLLILIEEIYKFNQRFIETHGESLSFFELITLMSLIYFDKKKVEVMIMEVGLGGLLDATNILNYDVSIITSIGFDHMKQLGNTLESIAYNKLGILKPGNHLITSVDPSMHHYFRDYLLNRSVSAEFYTSDDVIKISDIPLVFIVNKERYELSLIGEYQLLNALVSIKAIHYLFPNIKEETIQKGLITTKWLGRLEEIEKGIYIDGGHNTHAMEALKQSALKTFKGKKIWILFSALGDKDITGMIEILKTFSDHIFLTEFPDSRFQALPSFDDDKISLVKEPIQAIKDLQQQMDESTVLMITGSLHFAGYIKNNYK
ncbi:MAG: bifunctional folylpolyglutamate synthase/dihydrofolate synthase [Acholeplasmataceae bacterium]|nr:bifunctional folylpolyglutamate synthase/dihydrofolate synthase [Acholeplasmataceae bacterium]